MRIILLLSESLYVMFSFSVMLGLERPTCRKKNELSVPCCKRQIPMLQLLFIILCSGCCMKHDANVAVRIFPSLNLISESCVCACVCDVANFDFWCYNYYLSILWRTVRWKKKSNRTSGLAVPFLLDPFVLVRDTTRALQWCAQQINYQA